jgi:hypothetical protein
MHGNALSTAALFPLGLLFIADGPTSIVALVGVVATLAAGLVGRWLDQRRDDKRHAWELRERLATAADIREELLAHRVVLTDAIDEHTAAASAQVAVVGEQVKVVDVAVQEIKEKQAADAPAPNELATRIAIGKLLHELFNGLHADGLSAADESLAFQLGNQTRIKELVGALTPEPATA